MNFSTLLALAASTSILSLGVPQASYAQDSKAPSKLRICVATPAVQLGQGTSATGDPAAPVMASLIAHLSGPVADVIALQSRIAVQIVAEAAQLDCAYVVDTSITQKKGRKGFKGMLTALPALAGAAMPMLGGGGIGSYAAAAAAQGMITAQQQQGQEDMMAAMVGVAQNNIKKGDQVTLNYELFRVGTAAAVTSGELIATANDNGEDILSPLIAQTANAVLTAAMAPDS